jgi:predicted esterase/tetratricopeptide (TPR) repeat protein
MDYRELMEKGDYDTALKAINGLLKARQDDPDLFLDLACIHSLKGDVENALEALEEAVERGYDDYIRIATDTYLENVRSLPRLGELTERARRRLYDRLPGELEGKALRLREGHWTCLELRHPKDEFPSVDMRLSFDQEALWIEASVRDLHFRDGNRNWRYGDGFFINFVLPREGEEFESNRFYALGFSMQEGKPVSVLVNRNGTYYLSHREEISNRIEVDEGRRVAHYSISVPWSFLRPFRPLMDNRAGLNVIYVSQNDDRSRKRLRWVEDPHYDSEGTDKRRFAALYFEASEKSGLQLTGELENRLLDGSEMRASLVAFSLEEAESELEVLVSDSGDARVYNKRVHLRLAKGLNSFEEGLPLKGIEDGSYTFKAILRGSTAWTETFYKFDAGATALLADRIERLAELGESALLRSSISALRFRLSELERAISCFEKRDDPDPVAAMFRELGSLIEECRNEGHIYNRSGYLRTAYVSPVDGALLPYSLRLPEGFSPGEQHDLLVMLHGSGVDEVSLVRNLPLFKDYVVVGPRGRGLSDFWVGDSERDAVNVVETVKGMFSVEKTLLAGASMGGYGCWRLVFFYPDLFDGVMILSGEPFNPRLNIPEYDMRNHIGRAKGLPYLVIHGTDDHSVDIRHTDEFVDVLKREGYDIEYVRVEGGGHGNIDFSRPITEWLSKKGFRE